jgi:hypothetical protein
MSLWQNTWYKQPKRGKICFGSVSEVSVDRGRKAQVADIMASRKQRERECLRSWLFPSSAFILWAPSLWHSAAHIQGGSSSLSWSSLQMPSRHSPRHFSIQSSWQSKLSSTVISQGICPSQLSNLLPYNFPYYSFIIHSISLRSTVRLPL